MSNKFAFTKFYKGFSFALIGNLPYSVSSLMLFDYFYKSGEAKSFEKTDSFFYKYYTLFGYSLIINCLISVIIYPFDTLKRKFQVNGGIGYSNEPLNFRNEISKIIKNPYYTTTLYR